MKKNKIHGVYKISSASNPDKFYIGSSMDVWSRWRSHKERIINNRDCCPILRNYANKHGINDLVFEVLEQFNEITKDYLIDREQFYIDNLTPPLNASKTARSRYGTKNSPEANVNVINSNKKIGLAKRGKKRPPEVGRKISEALMGHELSRETRGKQSIVAINAFKNGRKHPMAGRKHKQESIEKMKHPKSEQGRENMRKARENRIITPEEHENRSRATRGRTPWNKGGTFSPTTREKQRISHIGKIPAMKGKHYPPGRAMEIREKRRKTIEKKINLNYNGT